MSVALRPEAGTPVSRHRTTRPDGRTCLSASFQGQESLNEAAPAAADEADTTFFFQSLRSPSVKVADGRKLATRWTTKRGKSLVYLDRDLRCGRKLILQVESAIPGWDYGLIFGVTSCGPSEVRQHAYHLVDSCRPEYDCCGHSSWLKLRHLLQAGSFVEIERVFDGFIRLTIDGILKKDMDDPPERGFGRSRTYPFLVMTGAVASVRIIPSVPTTRNQRPRAPWFGQRLPPQDHVFSVDSWISNGNVSSKEGILTRGSRPGANRYYIFSNSAFIVGKALNFKIRQVDSNVPGTLTFGVTTYTPSSVTLENLPINSSELMTNRFCRNWYLSQDIIETGRATQGVSLKRTPQGFTLKTGFKQIRYLFYVDPLLTVYPFFNFNGGVRSIELVRNSTALFNMSSMASELQSRQSSGRSIGSSAPEGKCVICLEDRADHMVVPCNHVAFCQSCAAPAMNRDERRCPLCRKNIERIIKIFLA